MAVGPLHPWLPKLWYPELVVTTWKNPHQLTKILEVHYLDPRVLVTGESLWFVTGEMQRLW